MMGRPPRRGMNSWIVGRIPWSQGKIQGISTIQPFFPKIRLENNCYSSSLRENPYAGSREFIRACGELFDLFDWSREFGAKSILEPECPIASKCRARLVFDCRLAREPERL